MTKRTTKLAELNLLDFGNTIQLAGAIYAGKDKAYVLVFPEDSNASELPLEFVDMSDEDWVAFLRQTDFLEVQVEDGSGKKAILRKSARTVDNNVSWEVYRRDGFACRYCGADKVPLTVDHLVCWEERGPWIAQNLLSACRKCNKIRGNTSYEDWLKSEHYLRVSQNLRPEVRSANEAILGTLATIPLVKHLRSR